MRTRIIVGGDGRCGSRHGTTEKLGQIWDGQLGGEFPVWFFEVEGEMIWGATARMIHELLSLVLVTPR